MKKSIITVLLICLFSGATKAQYWDKQFTSDLLILDEYVKRSEKGIDFKDTNSYTGTPYNNPSYLNGSIYKNDKLLATNVGLRYNAIADEIEVKKSLTADDEDAKPLTKSPDIYVKIVNEIFVFVPYQGGIEGGGYFRVNYEGSQINLYEKLEKKFTPERKSKNTLTQSVPAKFKDELTYYIVTKTGKFYQMPKSKSKKFNVFGENKDLVKKYVKDNDLDMDNEKDLISVLKYYENTLSSVSSK
ncbi:MAG: hypothetical protein ACSHW7_00920 [Patiriisocius sp.]|uniref:hypothetical protein n=1 Tax=Patiriisocius sp. TaxID=2822396 RepID=UPI003EF60040